MSDISSPLWTSGTTEVNRTGTWRNQMPDYINPPSPCHNACPVDHDIALWIQQIKEKDYHGAWLTLTANSPFPAVAGRVCHHPCESVCNRRDYDEAISICGLERFVGDMALSEGWSFPEIPISKEERVAIVGAGPAGLVCAFHLRRMGYTVILYEAQAAAGGLLHYGIPSYRLPKQILEQEIKRLLRLGIELKLNVPIGSRKEFDRLREEYDAVYLAIGACIPRRLPFLDYSHANIMDSREFLALANTGTAPATGNHVVVIGGGSAAMDVARTARRHDRQVTILALEPEELLPCQKEEILEAREEAISLLNGVVLQKVTDLGPQGLLLNCSEIIFTPGTKTEPFRIEIIADTEFSITADTIVSAIGQDPDLSIFGITGEGDSLLPVDAEYSTGMESVFAGGDVATMDRFVTHAFGMGKRAAGEIHRYLHPDEAEIDKKRVNRYLQENRTAETRDSSTAVNLAALNTWYYEHQPREHQDMISVTERLNGFNETRLNFPDGRALQEAERCFSCGNCIFCNHCLFHCPDMAITRIENGYRVNPDYCKGCGLCVRECPTGAIKMFEDKL